MAMVGGGGGGGKISCPQETLDPLRSLFQVKFSIIDKWNCSPHSLIR